MGASDFRSAFLSGSVILTGVCLAAALVASPLAFRSEGAARTTSALRVLGRFAFYALALLLSLPWFADEVHFLAPPPLSFWAAALPPFLVASLSVLVGVRRQDVDSLARGEAMLITATTLAFAAGLSLPSGKGASLVATLSLLFLGLGRVVRGNAIRARAAFIEGLLVLVLVFLSRVALSALEEPLRTGAAIAVLAAATVAVVAFERQ